ncbi:hypothetical protein M438DRAFT_347757 [Aureobasidium pullulans EXF-150]|uniref:Protein kinase domain-containing protein n=1 Tax=Aureobasidium pullulans EXF-150 TaxID=1043002 RepID=A0A074X9N9_AURPU|nr:uncharacterized protein M438DRAFT_347757 [Aureobasidium pullulans EXF-150]KEQ82078.1 hypothetical protein M438DRAFT_347757 [Aureobasidium pullulans EXF-150]
MELSHLLVDAVWRPSFVLKHGFLRANCDSSGQRDLEPIPWHLSQNNPINRINTLENRGSRWRIDGATRCGTQFFVTPIFQTSLTPLRVDVFVPDQESHPQHLRFALDSSLSVALRDGTAIRSLGISRHICNALDHVCDRDPDFLSRYQRLPFGSKLYFTNIDADVAKMELVTFHSHNLERQFITLEALQAEYTDSRTCIDWPRPIDITKLRLIQQIHDSISLVEVLEDDTPTRRLLIFKSNTNDHQHLYNELALLSRMPPHPNIMSRPIHIVTKKGAFGNKHGVVGFTLPYHSKGSIRDLLPRETRGTGFSMQRRLDWARQVTSALVHIRREADTFYSDLRPDNILLKANGDIVLCDFEQRGNWHEWGAPEVLFRQYVKNLTSQKDSFEVSTRWRNLLRMYEMLDDSTSAISGTYMSKINPVWAQLSGAEQEKAMVFSLGLLIYCLFEGISNVRNNIANTWPIDPDIEFPRFRHTPESLRRIIKCCTLDASEWDLGNEEATNPSPGGVNLLSRVIRQGSRLVVDASEKSSPVEVIDTAMSWWTRELERAELYGTSRERVRGMAGSKRPTLQEVSVMLDNLEVTT